MPYSWSYLVLLFFYSVKVAGHICSILYGLFFLHRRRGRAAREGVTIIKPLNGIEPGLEDNLTTHFTLENPKLQILLCFASADDPAIEICQRVIRRHPHVDGEIIITGGKSAAVNPLVANISPAFPRSKYGLIWVTTSRIKVSDEIMEDLTSKATNPRVGLAHQMPFVADPSDSFTFAVSTIVCGTFFARWSLFSFLLGWNIFVGMSYMFERDKMDRVIDDLGVYLNEDFHLGGVFTARGLKNVPSVFPARQNISHFTLNDLLQRHVRWNKMRLHSLLSTTCTVEVMEIIFFNLIVAAYLSPPGFGLWGGLLHLLCVVVSEYALICVCQNGRPPFGLSRYLLGWVVKEFGFVAVVLTSLIHPLTVKWGANVYRLHRGARIELFQ